MLPYIIVIIAGYLLGSIPTSIWVGKLYKGVDIRHHGSGNAGATNTFRMLGWKAGVIVAVIDFMKGFAAAYFVSKIGFAIGLPASSIGPWNAAALLRIAGGASAVIGHMFPLYANFKGGKGAITSAGMLFGIEPISISITVAIFLVVLLLSRYVSLASIICSICYPIIVLIMRYKFGVPLDGSLIVLSSIIAFVIVIKHLPNIKRLFEGKENRIRSFRPAKGRLNKEQQV